MYRLVGILLLIAGAAFVVWSYSMSQSVASQLSNALTGSPGDKVVHFFIAGVVCAAIGLLSIVRSR